MVATQTISVPIGIRENGKWCVIINRFIFKEKRIIFEVKEEIRGGERKVKCAQLCLNEFEND